MRKIAEIRILDAKREGGRAYVLDCLRCAIFAKKTRTHSKFGSQVFSSYLYYYYFLLNIAISPKEERERD